VTWTPDLSKTERRKYMKQISNHNIHIICEGIHNALNGRCAKENSKNKRICNHIKKLKKELRKLANPSYDIDEKRKILSNKQSGDGIFSIIASAVLPFLINLITGKRK
jgi:hypothetical protein